MTINKEEVEIVVGVLKSLVALYVMANPEAKDNKVVTALQNGINVLQIAGI